MACSHDEAIARTALRFSRATEGRSSYHYVVGKLRSDPFTRAISALGPLGDVLDIGCGRGQTGIFVLELGAARSFRGFDWDEDKVRLARRAAEGLEAEVEVADATRLRAEGARPADTVLLVDVLHYLDDTSQDELLRAAVQLVRPGGRLVVREASTGEGWRSTVTTLTEQLSRRVRLNIGTRTVMRDVRRDIVGVLEDASMSCTVEPCWRGTPFSNLLVVATRRT